MRKLQLFQKDLGPWSLLERLNPQLLYFCPVNCEVRRPGSSVSIVTNYGLDGPGSNPGRDEIFRWFRPALGSTQPPVKWVQGISRG